MNDKYDKEFCILNNLQYFKDTLNLSSVNILIKSCVFQTESCFQPLVIHLDKKNFSASLTLRI